MGRWCGDGCGDMPIASTCRVVSEHILKQKQNSTSNVLYLVYVTMVMVSLSQRVRVSSW